jgi:plastocyanin
LFFSSFKLIFTGASDGGGNAATSVSIVPGSSSLTTGAFSPNPIQVSVGNTVTWTNNDSQPHTVTSGSNGQPDNKFNSSPNFNPLLNPGQTFSFTFTQAGETIHISVCCIQTWLGRLA